jgi:hypothetical protein
MGLMGHLLCTLIASPMQLWLERVSLFLREQGETGQRTQVCVEAWGREGGCRRGTGLPAYLRPGQLYFWHVLVERFG